MNNRIALFCCVVSVAASAFAQGDRTQGRSMVVSRYGIVASEHPLASQAGAMILSQGGNAVDAAVAANAAMGVISPMMCGMGGDLFAIVYEARTGKLYGLNASGWSPAGMTIEKLAAMGITQMPQSGIHAVTVPGAVAGWDALLGRFGRKKPGEALAPAIRYAREGFPVSELVAGYWAAGEGLLRKDAGATKIFLPNGRAPKLGEVFANPEMAASLDRIAKDGRDGFYRGLTAEQIVRSSESLGGTMTAADLSEYKPEWVEPISITYRGWTVYEIPPNGQGIAALMMLNLMENFPLGQWQDNSAETLHVMIEAKKLAYADMLRFVADQRFAKVPVAGMLSKDYARNRAKLIDLEHASAMAQAGTPPMGNDTTYLCAVDAEGNMISLIQSLYNAFGSGVVAKGTGFALQNRGGLFSLKADHPNALAGRKRPLHTIIPAFMVKDDVRIAFGIMGGWNQSQAHAQFVSKVVDHGLNIQAALESPRFTKQTFEGNDVQMESRIGPEVRDKLAAKGHAIQLLGPFSGSVGGGQAVMRDFKAGVNYGASDPRKDGAAIPAPYPMTKPKSD